MQIWNVITTKTRELCGFLCDECGFIIKEKDIMTLRMEDSTRHFCCWKCVHGFAQNELTKEKQ